MLGVLALLPGIPMAPFLLLAGGSGVIAWHLSRQQAAASAAAEAEAETPVLLTSPAIRSFVRSIVERFRATTLVMSQNEIHPKARIRTVGQI